PSRRIQMNFVAGRRESASQIRYVHFRAAFGRQHIDMTHCYSHDSKSSLSSGPATSIMALIVSPAQQNQPTKRRPQPTSARRPRITAPKTKSITGGDSLHITGIEQLS